MVDSVVHASADRHCESVLRTSRATGNTRARMRHTEKNFGERRNTSVAVIRNPRTEKIRRERFVDSGPQDISVVICAEISDCAHPIFDVICE